MKDVVTNVQSLLNRFHRESVNFYIVHTEEISGSAGGEDQKIVRDFAVVGEKEVADLINALSLSHEEIDVFSVAEGIEKTYRTLKTEDLII